MPTCVARAGYWPIGPAPGRNFQEIDQEVSFIHLPKPAHNMLADNVQGKRDEKQK
jgi:hypothetical protein